MPFGGLDTLEEVLRTYQVAGREHPFLQPIPHPVDEGLQRRLQFFKLNAPFGVSEEAICEFIIAPILQQMWMTSFSDSLTLWSHAGFGKEPPLIGYPDYFFARRSPLGLVREQPYVFFIQAKRDDFDKAWGQCLAAMLAAQKQNAFPLAPVLGGVSNGAVWYFGKLEGAVLVRDPRELTLTHLDELFAALNALFVEAKQLAQQTAGLGGVFP